MKLFAKITLINLMCLSAMPTMADDITAQYNSQQTLESTKSISKYLLNLGKYFGYDIEQFPPQTNQNQTVSNTLLNPTSAQTIQLYLFNTLLGAYPVNAFSNTLAQFLPPSVPGASTLNAFANAVFIGQEYNNPQTRQQGGSQGTVSVSPLMDQQNYQADPVNQSILNILGTPNHSYCMNYDGTDWVSNCNLLFENRVAKNVIGAIPSTHQYFTYDYNQQFLSQLNSNALLGPLMYSTESTTNSSRGSAQNSEGLSAQSQAQQAQNFIRYVSGSITSTQLPKLKDYDKLYAQANPPRGSNITQMEKYQAESTLSNYFANLRTYAAQSSVGLSNLYFIMSKRLPQAQSSGNNSTPPASQAVTEFNMATKRLYNPDMSVNNQWINQLNNASPATVEKEIALLLAEISYQMYLDRQIQERILLTNSIQLMQNTKATQPSNDFSGAVSQ